MRAGRGRGQERRRKEASPGVAGILRPPPSSQPKGSVSCHRLPLLGEDGAGPCLARQLVLVMSPGFPGTKRGQGRRPSVPAWWEASLLRPTAPPLPAPKLHPCSLLQREAPCVRGWPLSAPRGEATSERSPSPALPRPWGVQPCQGQALRGMGDCTPRALLSSLLSVQGGLLGSGFRKRLADADGVVTAQLGLPVLP